MLFSPLLTYLFHEHSHRVFSVLHHATSEFCDTNFAGQTVYKPWVLSVSSEALMPITAILIPAADCALPLHQLVIGPVTVHYVMVLKCMHYITRITLNVSQTWYTVASQLGFKLGLLIWQASSLPTKPSRPALLLWVFFKILLRTIQCIPQISYSSKNFQEIISIPKYSMIYP